MSPVACRSATFETNRPTADVMTIDLPRDRRRHGRSVDGMDTDPETGLRNAMIDGRGGARDRRMRETGGFGVRARGAAVRTRKISSCLSPGEPLGTFRRCRFWSWRMSIG